MTLGRSKSGPLLLYFRLLSVLSAFTAPLIFPGTGVGRVPDTVDARLVRGLTRAGCPFMDGGVSFGERRAMEQSASPYNLLLKFAPGAITQIAPATLVIGANDGSFIEKVQVRGPWFFIQLPPGSYTILARFENRVVLVSDVYLGEEQQRTYVFRGESSRMDAKEKR
jgi:hypothetical protein